jgi:hypothetical protein
MIETKVVRSEIVDGHKIDVVIEGVKKSTGELVEQTRALVVNDTHIWRFISDVDAEHMANNMLSALSRKPAAITVKEGEQPG